MGSGVGGVNPLLVLIDDSPAEGGGGKVSERQAAEE
jgi:hypothetical protein